MIGTLYTGSSLLNLLLDSQPRVRGLGEAVGLTTLRDSAHCNLCGGPGCPLSASVDQGRFYGSIFDFYGDCDVLVDSSKSLELSVDLHPWEPDFERRIILLSKAPHEFAYSWLGHHPHDSVEGAFEQYLSFYSGQLGRLSGAGWFEQTRCVRVTYRELARRTAATISRVCEFLDTPYHPGVLNWQTDSHIIGGNWMVAAQVQNYATAFANPKYLRGKYAGRLHTIFYDDQWRSDPPFLQHCLAIYQRRQHELAPLLNELGQLDFRQQLSDLGDVPSL
jgi:hypothetical protein